MIAQGTHKQQLQQWQLANREVHFRQRRRGCHEQEAAIMEVTGEKNWLGLHKFTTTRLQISASHFRARKKENLQVTVGKRRSYSSPYTSCLQILQMHWPMISACSHFAPKSVGSDLRETWNGSKVVFHRMERKASSSFSTLILFCLCRKNCDWKSCTASLQGQGQCFC